MARLEDIAGHYVRELRRVQPDGPYCLAGSSAGGTFAFEMARQLTAAGQRVAVLAMFDTVGARGAAAERGVGRLALKASGILERSRVLVKSFAEADNKGEFLQKKADTLRRRRAMRLQSKQIQWAQEHGEEIPKNLVSVARRNLLALREYAKGAYPGRITLFRTFDRPVGVFPDEDYGWGRFAHGGVEIIKVPGNHLTMLTEPHVQVIGESLNTILARETATDA